VLALLNAEQTYLQAVVTRVQAEGNRLADVVGLFMALGGDWRDENLKNLTPSATRSLAAPFGEPAPQEVDTIKGPVNSDWFPSFWD
jgi:hypothetical protein